MIEQNLALKRKILLILLVKLIKVMASYSGKLPLTRDSNDGFQMLKTINEVAKQNFRMLLLTEPGERVWDQNYGVGLKRFLFEQRSSIESQLVNRINQQISSYLPYIIITAFDFIMDDNENLLHLRINFYVDGFNNSIQLIEI